MELYLIIGLIWVLLNLKHMNSPLTIVANLCLWWLAMIVVVIQKLSDPYER
jgi:hypothetical protein